MADSASGLRCVWIKVRRGVGELEALRVAARIEAFGAILGGE
jgi:hypothetical protein